MSTDAAAAAAGSMRAKCAAIGRSGPLIPSRCSEHRDLTAGINPLQIWRVGGIVPSVRRQGPGRKFMDDEGRSGMWQQRALARCSIEVQRERSANAYQIASDLMQSLGESLGAENADSEWFAEFSSRLESRSRRLRQATTASDRPTLRLV